MNRLMLALLLMVAFAQFLGCGDSGHSGREAGQPGAFDAVSKAVCVLHPTTGSELTSVAGVVTLTQTKNGLRIVAEITGLKPDSKHGFHIHQWGDITDTAAGAAVGGHFNPAGLPHGLPSEGHVQGDVTVHTTGGHAGALGNLQSDAGGGARFDMTFENISLTGFNAVLGRSFVVHLDEDTGEQPSGHAGPRVAQGVIGIADPEPEE